MIALRYVYVLALCLCLGGSIVVGLVAAPVSADALQRFLLMSSVSGSILLLTLVAMGLLGPRPSWFAARFGVAVVMCAATVSADRQMHALSSRTLAVTVICGLALLFWEARDGTRAT